jgi:hypothetical protein
MSLLKPVTDEPVVIQEVEGEPVAIGLPRSLQRMSDLQRREWITAALRGEVEDEPIAA